MVLFVLLSVCLCFSLCHFSGLLEDRWDKYVALTLAGAVNPSWGAWWPQCATALVCVMTADSLKEKYVEALYFNTVQNFKCFFTHLVSWLNHLVCVSSTVILNSSWVRGLRITSYLEGYLIFQTRELSRYLFYVLPTYSGNQLDFSMGNTPLYSLFKCWMGLDPGATNGPSVWWIDFTLWPQELVQGWAHHPNQSNVTPSRTFVGTRQEEMSFLAVVTRLVGRL